jgi:3'(2'), 5'-bisphosphate nucleotidase
MLRIAREAGAAIMDIYKAGTELCANGLAQKEDGSPLTRADMLAHQLIASGLAAVEGTLPVVSEEDSASLVHRTPHGRYWLIDPLDGTKEFLTRSGEFTVNIALIENGVSVAGAIVAPALDLAYWGALEEGAWRDAGDGPQRLAVSTPAPQERLRVIASRSHLDEATREYLDSLGQHLFVQAGSSLKFCRVAEGSADLYPRFGPTCEWDVAAAQAILEAAGGRVVCLDGAPLRYGKRDILNPPFVAFGGAAQSISNGRWS